MLGFGHTDGANTTPRKREFGGGFLAEGESPAAFGSPSAKRANASQATLRPVTIKQLVEAAQPHPDASFRIDEHDVSQVVLVACVRNMQSQGSGTVFSLEDGTGLLEGRLYAAGLAPPDDHGGGPDAPEDGVPVLAATGAPIQVGTWVRAVATLRAFNGRRSLNLADIRPLEDANMLVHHMASVIQSHLALARGLTVQARAAAVPYSGHNPLTAASTSTVGGAPAAMPYASELTPAQQQVLAQFAACTVNEGLHFDAVVRSLKPHMREDEVRHIIDWLIEEGHLYATIDNVHAKATTA